MSMNSASLMAGGNIYPARFVKMDDTNHEVVQGAAATDDIIGISQESQKDAPTPSAADYAATSGESVPVYFAGSVCRLQIGTGGASPGTRLVADSDGKGVASATSGTALQCVGAISLETASADEYALVLCIAPTWRRAAVA